MGAEAEPLPLPSVVALVRWSSAGWDLRVSPSPALRSSESARKVT